ncbi:MAG: DUF3847 domain-containing protein [Lachnospiraceae bacterium]|nr:DUF3847 domain-containing protein [Lachnospiraceae bacterium]
MTGKYEEELKKVRKKMRNLKNEEKVLMREAREISRSDRAHRLIVRGAILEKHLKKPLVLTDDDISSLMEYIFSQDKVEEKLDSLLSERARVITEAGPYSSIA